MRHVWANSTQFAITSCEQINSSSYNNNNVTNSFSEWVGLGSYVVDMAGDAEDAETFGLIAALPFQGETEGGGSLWSIIRNNSFASTILSSLCRQNEANQACVGEEGRGSS